MSPRTYPSFVAALCAASILSACAGVSSTSEAVIADTWPPFEAQAEAADAFDAAALGTLAQTMQGFVDDGHVIGMQTLLVKAMLSGCRRCW